MIYITGDTHGNWMCRLRMSSFPEQEGMTKKDYIIICGDFGIWDNSKREKFNLDWLDSRPFTTLVVSGNHENYDILDSLPVDEWHGGMVNYIRPSVIHLMRGQIFEIEKKQIFTFGGASSHDISAGILEPDDPCFKEKKKRLDRAGALYRINHVSWWKRELPNEEEMEEGLHNLEKQGNKVDYIITHSPYTSLLEQMDSGWGIYKKDYLTEYLQKIRQTVDYKQWVFGHMHISQNFYKEKAICIYDQIVKMV